MFWWRIWWHQNNLIPKNGWNGPYFQRREKHGRNHYIKKRLNTHNLHIPGYNIWKGDKNWMNSLCVNGTNVVDRSGRTPCMNMSILNTSTFIEIFNNNHTKLCWWGPVAFSFMNKPKYKHGSYWHSIFLM